ncbi:MAG: zinc metallopeptidase [bacterium]|nr:zinc metallopeptidase [bacterium]
MNDYSYFLTEGLIWLSLLITVGAQIFINVTYKKFAQIKNKKNLTGAQVAKTILLANGLSKIQLTQTKGDLTDHFDPRAKAVTLSTAIYTQTSVAALAVAAHECGHVLQEKDNFRFLRWRSSLVPVVNFASYAGYFAIMVGLLFSSVSIFWLGILFEVVILAFQLVTLPVEFDASRRALAQLQKLDLCTMAELPQAKKVLTAAAFTYVAGVLTALLQIVRLLAIFRNSNRD